MYISIIESVSIEKLIVFGQSQIQSITSNCVILCSKTVVEPFYINSKVPITTRLGKVDLFGNEDNLEPQDVAIIERIVHPDYDHNSKVHDIALLRLEAPVRFTEYVKPVCLYQNWDIPSNTGLLVAGWGANETGGKCLHSLKIVQYTVYTIKIKN